MKVKNILNNKMVKIMIKIIRFIFFVLLGLSIFFAVGNAFINYLDVYGSGDYEFAKNILIAEANINILMVGIFLLSMFLNKKTMLIVWLFVFLNLHLIFSHFPERKLLNDIDWCDDMEYCVEGVREWVTREDCEDRGKAWNLDDNACAYRFEAKDCHKLEGNWKYPKSCD